MAETKLYSQSALIDLVLAHLRALEPEILIGDGEAPVGGAWAGGQAGEGAFTSYVTLASQAASAGLRSSLSRTQDSWVVPFTLRHVGGDRSQATWTADEVRARMLELTYQHYDLGACSFMLSAVIFTSIGAVSRTDATDPPYWEVLDGVSLSLDG